jgi:DNA-binding response OmpR family regulator
VGPSPPVSTHSRPIILLAEDDFALRKLIAGQLEAAGYEVFQARNGGEFIDYVANTLLFGARFRRPALIITDVRMPGLSGLDVVEGLRRANYDASVIVITAFGSPETHALARKLGAIAVFDKPLDIDELVERVVDLAPPNPDKQ